MWQNKLHWHHWLILSAILLSAIYLRCNNLGRNSLWIDEFLSLECSSGWGRYDLTLTGASARVPDFITLKNARPLGEIWHSVSTDENHPPLYFLVLRLWRVAFGDSPTAIRSLSVVASSLAVLLIFFIGTVVHSPRAGLWAAILMALAIPQIQQAQDARSYMPMTAVCLAAALALVLIDKHGPTISRTAALCVFALSAALVHYMALATLASLFIYAVIAMRGSARRAALLSLSAAFALFCLLWGPALFSQHFRMIDATNWLVVDQSHPLLSTFKNVCTVPARLFLDLDFDDVNLPIACLGVTGLLLPLIFVHRHRIFWLWSLWLIIPILTGLIIDLSMHRNSLSMVKYTLATAPAMYLLLGFLAAHMRRLGWIPSAAIATCCAISLSSAYTSQLPDWREVSRAVSKTTRPGDPLVFVDLKPNPYANGRLLSVSFYLAQQHYPLFVIDRPPAQNVKMQLASVRHACVIADCLKSLNKPLIPGLSIDRTDFLYRMALVGSVDPPAVKLANAATNPPFTHGGS